MLRLIKLMIWCVIILGGIFFWKYQSFSTQEVCVNFVEDGYIQVEKGENFHSVLIRIFDAGLLVRLYLKQHPPSFELQAGKYEATCGNISEIIESLKNPMSETDEQITILEGWNIFDIDDFLSRKNLITTGEFISFAENNNLAKDYVFLDGISSLEGYLYPDTYAINPNNFTVEILARKMLDNFNAKIFQGMLVDAANQDIFEIITLASIVEKEERDASEKPTVAGILKKRLEEGWMIGADITVCYPFRLTSEQCKLSVTKYLYEVNDYNTRQKVGLPAGPIGNPSQETIEATMFSKDTPYYYYLHDTQTGKIYYGVTNADHERNKQLYLR